jgi:hypothetical protein
MCLTTAWIYNGIVGLTAIVIRSFMTEQFRVFLSAQIGDALETKEVGKKIWESCEPKPQPFPNPLRIGCTGSQQPNRLSNHCQGQKDSVGPT